MTSGITVVIPTIPGREQMLRRALASVEAQHLQPDAVVVEPDRTREGAAVTRQRGLEQVKTPWVAFLDDDDEFMPGHLLSLRAAAYWDGADFVFSWYEVVGGTDPRPGEFGLLWDHDNPRQTTVTTLVRADLAKGVGGFVDEYDTDLTSPDRHYGGEDWRLTSRVNAVGAQILHLPVKTWRWHHHASNTSGLPRRSRRISGIPSPPG